ncbi:MAG: ADP-ribosyl-[dinitrogen reductase] hydrolase [Rhodocyclaceae bacterium]|nr:ADP-ribosyl-[dinitrogen reductase] hydrolase [Rhodocyclaceae bacterium]
MPAESPQTAGSVPPANLQRQAEAAYLGLAVGDALGATVEFLTPREIRCAFAAQHGIHREIVGGGWLHLPPGQVTDDTTMSLALGEAILQRDGTVEAQACARAFDAWMRGKPVDIGNTVRRNLMRFRRHGNPQVPPSEHDAGNGAAMRVLPVALALHDADERTLCDAVRVQAHVTHHNAESDAACEFLVLALHDGLHGTTLRRLYRERIHPFVNRHPQFRYRPRRAENPSGYVVHTLHAVLQALLDTGSFEECLIDVVNRGGDADTTGAIAGMLAGVLYGLESIPLRWLRALNPDIRARCRGQARALIERRHSPNTASTYATNSYGRSDA